MSDLEEPPAKVLKIDNIDGVTHVTELSEMPGADSIVEELETMGEESGIIEKGADCPDHEEGQEEWLSDGILTDDDYNNPSSQEADDHTDSQLGTDDDRPNNSTEHFDTAASEANVAEREVFHKEENMLESEANMGEEHLVEMEEHLESQTFTQDNSTESETFTQNSKTYTLTSEANVIGSESSVTGSLANINNSQANVNSNVLKTELKAVEMSIEETMNNLEGNNAKFDVFDSLLIKKSDVKKEQKNEISEVKEEEDDGNDTDDLLRMLGEDDNKSMKKLTKTVKDIRAAVKSEDASSDDDDFVYEGAAMKKLKAAKNALAKKQPAAKAVPEDMEDGDDETEVSGDEMVTVKKMFNLRTPKIVTKSKPQAKPVSTPKVVVKQAPVKKNVVNIVQRPVRMPVQSQSTPIKQYHNKRLSAKSILKPSPAPPPQSVAAARAAAAPKLLQVKREPATVKLESGMNSSFKPPEVKTPAPFKSSGTMKSVEQKKLTRLKKEPEEIIDEEEFLDDDEFDLGEDEFGDSDLDEVSKNRQRIMRPEMMDEEMPSDGESHSEDGSLYDELPSSDSEDMDDWFQLDIRAEKAGDYIPLLGSRAKDLLLDEKRRVIARLQTLKQSLTALTDSGKKQAEQLRDATMSLAELDDMLKAS